MLERKIVSPRRKLLTHDDANAAAPALRETYTRDFDFRADIAKDAGRGGMETESGSDEVDEWRRLLQFDTGKISVTRKVSLSEMPADARIVVGGLQREMDVFGGF